MLPQTPWEQARAMLLHGRVAAPASIAVHHMPPGKHPFKLAQRARIALTATGTNYVYASPLQHCVLIWQKKWTLEAIQSWILNLLSTGSSKSASWVCVMHGSWVAKVHSRVVGSGCPSCAILANCGARPGRWLLKDECPESLLSCILH